MLSRAAGQPAVIFVIFRRLPSLLVLAMGEVHRNIYGERGSNQAPEKDFCTLQVQKIGQLAWYCRTHGLD